MTALAASSQQPEATGGTGDPASIIIEHLTHRYHERTAVDDLSMEIRPGEIFGFLGPNGSGKTTLFRILATLLRPSSGSVSLLGLDLARQADAIRARIGVVFQSAALDEQLTVRENLRHHGHLHGLAGHLLRERIDGLMHRLRIDDRASDRVRTLSGGLKRRVDLARGLLHAPRLLILDEPSTGLDPGSRRDLWAELSSLRRQTGVTVLITTHLLDEGDRCDRIAILDGGRLVALDHPEHLRREIGGSVVLVRAREPQELCRLIEDRFQLLPHLLDGSLRLEHPDGPALVPRLAAAFPELIESVTVQAPTLEDVFVHRTGHRFEDEGAPGEEAP